MTIQHTSSETHVKRGVSKLLKASTLSLAIFGALSSQASVAAPTDTLSLANSVSTLSNVNAPSGVEFPNWDQIVWNPNFYTNYWINAQRGQHYERVIADKSEAVLGKYTGINISSGGRIDEIDVTSGGLVVGFNYHGIDVANTGGYNEITVQQGAMVSGGYAGIHVDSADAGWMDIRGIVSGGTVGIQVNNGLTVNKDGEKPFIQVVGNGQVIGGTHGMDLNGNASGVNVVIGKGSAQYNGAVNGDGGQVIGKTGDGIQVGGKYDDIIVNGTGNIKAAQSGIWVKTNSEVRSIQVVDYAGIDANVGIWNSGTIKEGIGLGNAGRIWTEQAGIVNTGTIGHQAMQNGSPVNSEAIKIYNNSQIAVTNGIGIQNGTASGGKGTIWGDITIDPNASIYAKVGIYNYQGSTINGSINLNGTLAGDIINGGLITGNIAMGFYGKLDTLQNLSGGAINGNISLRNGANFVNAGSIGGNITMNGGVFVNEKTGSIVGKNVSVTVTNGKNTSFSNAGNMSGTTVNVAGSYQLNGNNAHIANSGVLGAINFGGTGSAVIANFSGASLGSFTNLGSGAVSFVNAGTVTGNVKTSGSGTMSVSNTGTIKGDVSFAINNSIPQNAFVNTGTLEKTLTITGPMSNHVFANSGTIKGDIKVSGTDSSVGTFINSASGSIGNISYTGNLGEMGLRNEGKVTGNVTLRAQSDANRVVLNNTGSIAGTTTIKGAMLAGGVANIWNTGSMKDLKLSVTGSGVLVNTSTGTMGNVVNDAVANLTMKNQGTMGSLTLKQGNNTLVNTGTMGAVDMRLGDTSGFSNNGKINGNVNLTNVGNNNAVINGANGTITGNVAVNTVANAVLQNQGHITGTVSYNGAGNFGLTNLKGGVIDGAVTLKAAAGSQIFWNEGTINNNVTINGTVGIANQNSVVAYNAGKMGNLVVAATGKLNFVNAKGGTVGTVTSQNASMDFVNQGITGAVTIKTSSFGNAGTINGAVTLTDIAKNASLINDKTGVINGNVLLGLKDVATFQNAGTIKGNISASSGKLAYVGTSGSSVSGNVTLTSVSGSGVFSNAGTISGVTTIGGVASKLANNGANIFNSGKMGELIVNATGSLAISNAQGGTMGKVTSTSATTDFANAGTTGALNLKVGSFANAGTVNGTVTLTGVANNASIGNAAGGKINGNVSVNVNKGAFANFINNGTISGNLAYAGSGGLGLQTGTGSQITGNVNLHATGGQVILNNSGSILGTTTIDGVISKNAQNYANVWNTGSMKDLKVTATGALRLTTTAGSSMGNFTSEQAIVDFRNSGSVQSVNALTSQFINKGTIASNVTLWGLTANATLSNDVGAKIGGNVDINTLGVTSFHNKGTISGTFGQTSGAGLALANYTTGVIDGAVTLNSVSGRQVLNNAGTIKGDTVINGSVSTIDGSQTVINSGTMANLTIQAVGDLSITNKSTGTMGKLTSENTAIALTNQGTINGPINMKALAFWNSGTINGTVNLSGDLIDQDMTNSGVINGDVNLATNGKDQTFTNSNQVNGNVTFTGNGALGLINAVHSTITGNVTLNGSDKADYFLNNGTIKGSVIINGTRINAGIIRSASASDIDQIVNTGSVGTLVVNSDNAKVTNYGSFDSLTFGGTGTVTVDSVASQQATSNKVATLDATGNNDINITNGGTVNVDSWSVKVAHDGQRNSAHLTVGGNGTITGVKSVVVNSIAPNASQGNAVDFSNFVQTNGDVTGPAVNTPDSVQYASGIEAAGWTGSYDRNTSLFKTTFNAERTAGAMLSQTLANHLMRRDFFVDSVIAEETINSVYAQEVNNQVEGTTFAKVYGSHNTYNMSGTDVSGDDVGLVVGANYFSGKNMYSFFGGYEMANNSGSAADSAMKMDMHTFYVGGNFNRMLNTIGGFNTFAKATVKVAYTKTDLQRTLSLGTVDNASADTDTWSVGANMSYGATYDLSETSKLVPMIGIGYAMGRTGDFTMSGSQLGDAYHDNQVSMFYGDVSMNWLQNWTENLRTTIGGGVRYNFTDTQDVTAVVSNTNYVGSFDLPSTSGYVNAQLTYGVTKTSDVSVGYTGVFDAAGQSHNATVKYSLHF